MLYPSIGCHNLEEDFASQEEPASTALSRYLSHSADTEGLSFVPIFTFDKFETWDARTEVDVHDAKQMQERGHVLDLDINDYPQPYPLGKLLQVTDPMPPHDFQTRRLYPNTPLSYRTPSHISFQLPEIVDDSSDGEGWSNILNTPQPNESEHRINIKPLTRSIFLPNPRHIGAKRATQLPCPLLAPLPILRDNKVATSHSRKRKAEPSSIYPEQRRVIMINATEQASSSPPCSPRRVERKSRGRFPKKTGRAGPIIVPTRFPLEPRYVCPLDPKCDHSVLNPARTLDLDLHERIRHIPRDPVDGMYHCPIIVKGIQCRQMLLRVTDFLYHFQKKDHTNIPGFYCLCGGTFTRKDALKRHISNNASRAHYRINRNDWLELEQGGTNMSNARGGLEGFR